MSSEDSEHDIDVTYNTLDNQIEFDLQNDRNILHDTLKTSNQVGDQIEYNIDDGEYNSAHNLAQREEETEHEIELTNNHLGNQIDYDL